MTSFRIRPRFRMEVAQNPEEIREAFEAKIQEGDHICALAFYENHILLKINAEEAHYWSPQLNLSLEKQEEHTLIRGLYGPKPSVWTLFIFAYVSLGILSIFVLMLGLSQIGLGLAAPVLWLIPLFAICALGLYIASQMGQKLASAQLFTLHHLFEEVIHHRVIIH